MSAAGAGGLARLAAACGIALEYVANDGRVHRVPPRTLRALLGAMGVEVGTDEDAERALAGRERAQWSEAIAPLVVMRDDAAPASLRVRLAEPLPQTLALEIALEQGGAASGTIATAQAIVERRAFGGDAFAECALPLPSGMAHGYHDVRIFADGKLAARTTCALAPASGYRPPALRGGARAWGAALQLYGVRSSRNWGIGDFTDLATIVQQWAAAGAAVVGVNPLHALFLHDAERASPYSPSSRLFVNPLYLDVTAIADFRECAAAREAAGSAAHRDTIAALRDAPLVDYARVAAIKKASLERLFAHFAREHLARDDRRAAQFRRFVDDGGEPLARYATFEALQEQFARDDPAVWGWPAWPEAYRDPRSADVARFADAHRDRVAFFEYLQWQSSLQLDVVRGFAAEAGMAVGLYADLAVSVDRGGAETWANRELYAIDASVGAPPDAFSPGGQQWGLPPFVPDRLRAAGYAPFIALLRAQMRHAGALRVDHVMGLERLFWVPPGGEPADGAYVHYPADDLFGLLALESERNRCLVIGEDLGTVTPSVREALDRNDVLGSRVLWFERERDGGFRPPARYAERALVCVSTHDLPTLAGWWRARDVELRASFGLIDEANARAQRAARLADRAKLLRALDREGLLPPGERDAASRDDIGVALARAVHAFIAATPCTLALVQLDDVAGVVEQANLPGTVGEHPNWRRKLPLALDDWPRDERFAAIVSAVDGARKAARRRATVAPRATYRLQLHADFTFRDAAALLPYLADLGVSHVYCSPYLRARPGSRHGYDIVDHASLNPEIGSREDFDAFVHALKRHGMGQLLDMVPNHMGVMGADNAWWMDVLENGRASRHADYFDIDWEPLDATMAGRVLAPVLGAAYGVALAGGEVKLAFEPDRGTFAVRYFDHRLPVDPRDYATIVERALGACEASLAPRAAVDTAALVARFRALPSRDDPAPDRVDARRREIDELKPALAALVARNEPLAAAIARVVERYNGDVDTLHALLDAQAYRLAHWRVASDEINYRRFFDVNDLAALRMENDAVFDATHALALGLAARGDVDGLRIDHPDGLYDPARYFDQLQRRFAALAGAGASLYVVVEKIRASGEPLPRSWAVDGDTGYDFANDVNGLFVDPAAKGRMERAWRAFAGDEAVSFGEAAYRGRRLVMQSTLAAELAVLANRATRIARADRRTRDYTNNALREAIAETVAHFPVYRTYVTERGASAQDRRCVDTAIARAKRTSRAAEVGIFDFVRALMTGEPAPELADLRSQYIGFAMRVQQFTAPVAAKGIEDTALYRFNRLVSLNDVGGDPDRFGTTVAAFHRAAVERASRWPATLLATSTHDNKRSEDVRTRIDVLCEMPAAWRLAARRWAKINRSHKRDVGGRKAPSRNDEYLLYQTLAGSLPPGKLDSAALGDYSKRIVAYMTKAAREAKVDTSWINVDAEYEDALASFVAGALGNAAFVDDLAAFVAPLAWFGGLNSLSMTLLKITQPGVPDIYQGCEAIDLSLVDPDNRRPVDFGARREALASLRALEAGGGDLASRVRALVETPHDGRAKLWVALRALALRREHEALFESGAYRALDVAGACSRHVVACARHGERHTAIVIAGRLFASLGIPVGEPPLGEAAWSDTAVDASALGVEGKLRNALTGESVPVDAGRIRVAGAFASFPAALLLGSEPNAPGVR